MSQTTGTKLMGQAMDTRTPDKALSAADKQTLIQKMGDIAEVFGDDRGLLKHLLSLTDEEMAGVHKFAQAYDAGAFPIDVIVDTPQEKKTFFP